MKKCFLSVAYFFIAVAVMSQTKDEQQLSAAVDSLIQAIIHPNKATLELLAANDLSYGHSSGKVENKAQFVDALTTGPFDFLSGEISDQTMKITDNIGVVRHVFSFKFNNNGQSGENKLGILLVWQKQKGRWKLLARQAFKL